MRSFSRPSVPGIKAIGHFMDVVYCVIRATQIIRFDQIGAREFTISMEFPLRAKFATYELRPERYD